MIKIQKIDLQPIFDIVVRRKWWIIISLLVSLVGGAVYIAITPKTYKSTTLILVEAQRIPSSYVKSTITETLQSRLNTISQQVKSRTNLERIINQFKLNEPREKGRFEKIKDKILKKLGLGAEDNKDIAADNLQFINFVRKKIQVSLKGGKKAFEISFEWYDPKIAADVANALASQFIEENLKIREQMAMGTTKFLETEVNRLKLQLEKKEKELEEFKKQNLGMLPNELNSNISILNQLKDEYNNLMEAINLARQKEIALQEQLDSEKALRREVLGKENKVASIEELELKLKELRSIYTEKHPDVVALEKRIKRLKQRKDRENYVEKKTKGPLYYQLKQIRNSIKNYEKRLQKIKEQIALYKKRIEMTPKISLQLEKMQKEYSVISKRYQDLLAKKLNAEMAEELEKRQKGEQFRILDLAVPSSVPYSPDVKRVGIFSILFGLCLGGGLAFLRESLDPAFYTPEEIEAYLGVKVIVCLPTHEFK